MIEKKLNHGWFMKILRLSHFALSDCKYKIASMEWVRVGFQINEKVLRAAEHWKREKIREKPKLLLSLIYKRYWCTIWKYYSNSTNRKITRLRSIYEWLWKDVQWMNFPELCTKSQLSILPNFLLW